MGLPIVLCFGLFTGLAVDGVSGRTTFLVAYGSAVCGRAISGLFTGLLAAPDMRLLGLVVAVEVDDVAVSVDFTEVVDAMDMLEAILAGPDAAGGAMAREPELRLAIDFDFAGDMEAIAVIGLAGCLLAAAARLSAAILSLKDERAPPGLPVVEAEKPDCAPPFGAFGLCESRSKADLTLGSREFSILYLLSVTHVMIDAISLTL